MIYASLSERERYMGIHPALDRALSLLTEEYLKSIPTVRTEIDGDTLFALATGQVDREVNFLKLCAAAAEVTARAIVNAVLSAR